MLAQHATAHATILLVAFAFVGGCRRSSQIDLSATTNDGGTIVTDSGSPSNDGRPTGTVVCSPAGPEVDGGLHWSVGPQALVTSVQTTAWQVESTAPECAAISPPGLPPQLSWMGPDAANLAPWCDPPIVDGQGNLTVFSLADLGAITTALPRDGSLGGILANGLNEDVMTLVPRQTGFVLLSHTFRPSCDFARVIAPSATPVSSTVLIDGDETDWVKAIFVNPVGGYVQARETNQAGTLQLRWVDDVLQPLGTWETVINWDHNNSWKVIVDQQGRALVLSFMYPPSFGGSPPQSDWKFSARWMDANGPVTDAFDPTPPIFTSGTSSAFAGWGTIVSTPGGGTAMFQAQAPSGGGTISPTGWYAFYPSGEPTQAAVPGWLQQYDGSLRDVAGGHHYAALQRDPSTCGRTLTLIAPSGQTCFRAFVEGSELCNSKDRISSDGTLILQNGCHLYWWPGIARSQ